MLSSELQSIASTCCDLDAVVLLYSIIETKRFWKYSLPFPPRCQNIYQAYRGLALDRTVKGPRYNDGQKIWNFSLTDALFNYLSLSNIQMISLPGHQHWPFLPLSRSFPYLRHHRQSRRADLPTSLVCNVRCPTIRHHKPQTTVRVCQLLTNMLVSRLHAPAQ